MADFDEELRRQAAISSLLAQQPESQPLDTQTDEQVVAQPEVIKPDTQADYHKLINQAFDTAKPSSFETKTDEQVVAQPDTTVYPTIAQDQPAGLPKNYPNISPPAPEPADVQTDPETGTRYVQDPLEGKIPHAEIATEADKEAFKPSDVTLPEETTIGTGAPIEVRRGERVLEVPKPTPESSLPESVPGFVTDSKNAILNPAAGVIPPAPRAEIVQDPIVTRSIAKNIADQSASAQTQLPNAPVTPPPATQLPNAPVAPPDQTKLQIAQPTKVTVGEGFFGGDLTQGPPGTKPNGTEDEPYWPKAEKDIALLPAGVNYIDPKDQSQKVTPGTLAPAATPAATPATPPEIAQPKTNDDYNKLVDSIWPSKAATPAGQVTTVNPDGTPFPVEQAPNGQAPSALIIHHTSGRGSPANVVDGWRTERPGVGSQFIMDRDGVIHDTQKEFGYGGTGHFLHSVIPGVSNQTAVGIEVIAKNDADMTPAQLESLKKFAGPDGPYAKVPVYGHSDVSPGDRDNEGVRGVAAINEARAAGPTAPTGEPGTTPIETLVKLDQSGLNVTHFGYEKPGESGYDSDSAAGHGKYVKDLIPGYDVALNSAGAALVGNPKPGETFTFAGKEFRYGDAVSEKLTEPRFDIFDPTGTALTGSMPVGKQVAVAAADKMPWDDWPKLSPEDQATAEKEGKDFQTQQASVLDNLNQSTSNPKQFWEKLQSPIEGVTDAQRKAYAENWKKEVTAHAQDFYGEKDPEKAFTKAVSDPGFDAYITNIGRGLAGAVGQADIGIALAGKSIDRNRVDGFMNLVHPDSTGEGRAGFVKSLTDIQDKRHRHDVFNEIYGALPQNTKDAIGDPASILDSIDNLADPKYQADLNKGIATKKAWVDQQLAGDPSLRGTDAAWWTTGTGENLFNTVAALVPGGVGAVVRTSTLGAQIYSSNLDKIAKEHPGLTPEQVSDEASRSAFMTLLPQEVVMALSHGITAPLLKWVGAAAEKPIVRFGIGGGVQVGAAAVGGAAGQVGENIAENKPLLTNVPQAAGAAVVQSLPFAVHGGIGALGHEPAPAEHVAPAEPAPTEPARIEPAPSRPVTASEMLGPDRPETPPARSFTPEQEAYNKWYPDKTVEPGQDPLVIRGAERNWTPQELADLIDRAPNSVARINAPTGLHLGDEGALEAEQTRQSRVNQPPITPTELLTRRPEPVDLNTAIAQQRAAAALSGTPLPHPASEPSPVPPTHVSESEPFTSKVANRYTAERMATGELGHIDPSQGKSTEEMVAQGLKMLPDQRERMIDNFTRGVGGDLDNQGAAIRSKEVLLSVQSSEAARAAEADPTNQRLKAEADAALKAVTDFHNGPVKKFKRVWSDAGRGLQREVPLDYTTLNGMREAYMKGQGNGKAAPPEMEPALKQTAARVKKSAADEQTALNSLGGEIEKQTRGKALPSNDSIRAKLMKIMGDLPCRN